MLHPNFLDVISALWSKPNLQVNNKNKLKPLRDINNCAPPPPSIYFKHTPLIRNNPHKNINYLNIKIQNQPVDTNIFTIFLYAPIFNTRLAEVLLKYLM